MNSIRFFCTYSADSVQWTCTKFTLIIDVFFFSILSWKAVFLWKYPFCHSNLFWLKALVASLSPQLELKDGMLNILSFSQNVWYNFTTFPSCKALCFICNEKLFAFNFPYREIIINSKMEVWDFTYQTQGQNGIKLFSPLKIFQSFHIG